MLVGIVPSVFCSFMPSCSPQSRQSIARFGRLRSGTGGTSDGRYHNWCVRLS
jgi:hypothetical protein